MKQFEHLVIVDNAGIAEFVSEDLKRMARKVEFYEDFPADKSVIARRVQDADAVLVSWNTRLDRDVLAQCANLKYIGLCCTYFDERACNVDVSYCREKSIAVTDVRHYGDYGVAEYVICELIKMVKGLGPVSFYEEQRELHHMKLGIIGMGTLGALIASAAAFFGMEVSYYSRNRKPDCPYEYMDKETLLRGCDVIVTCVPRNQIVMGEEEFTRLEPRKIFVNVGVGPSFDQPAFEMWIGRGGYAILDGGSCVDEKKDWYRSQSRISLSEKVAGFTYNARQRLARKAVENIRNYLETGADKGTPLNG